jgi:hypothetical protein
MVPIVSTESVSDEVNDTTVVECVDTTATGYLNVHTDSVATPSQRSRLMNEYAYSEAYWDGCLLHHSLGIWPGANVVIRVPKYYRITRTVTRTLTRTEYREKPIEVEKKLSSRQRLCVDFFLPSFVLNLALAGWIFRKK